MKKGWKKTIILTAVILALVVIAAVALLLFMRRRNVQTLIQQQNYVASRLLEMGDYEEGRQLAASSEQSSPNAVSEELLVLAIVFQEDYDSALRYAALYNENDGDAVLSALCQEVEEYQQALEELSADEYAVDWEAVEELEEDFQSELLILLLQVQESISVKKDSAAVLSMINLLSSDSVSASDTTDNSLLSKKVETLSSLKTGNYSEALETAQELLAGDSSFENRALVSNIAAAGGASDSGLVSQNSEVQALKTEKSELQSQLYELQTQYEEAASDSKKLNIQSQIEKKEEQIAQKDDEIRTTPAKQAINYIETTTPVTQRNTVSYQIELAQLYYQADNEEKAEEILLQLFKEDPDGSGMDGLLLEDLLENYQDSGLSDETKQAWERIADLLNLMDSNYSGWYYSGSGETFYDFVMALLDQKFNGLIIRQIDATNFPTVRVTVNVALDLDEELEEKDFTLYDMGVEVSDFTLLDQESLKADEDLSVVLVVDHSGSMSGTAMEDTKSAVASFIRDMDEDVDLGLVIFDSSAEVVSSLGSSHSELLRGISLVEAQGGTSIYLGLELAGEELMSASGRRVIILLSDGNDGDTGKIDQVLETLNNHNIYVYTIGFGGADTEYLSYIASQCGGKFIEASSSELLTEIYASIGQYIQNDYVFEFTAVTDTENYSRILRVEADISDAYAEREYDVGVPLEDILSEDEQTPLADYFKQIGGSFMGTEEDAQDAD